MSARTEVRTRLVGGPLEGEDHYRQDAVDPPSMLEFVVSDDQHPYPPGRKIVYRRAPELDGPAGPAMYEFVDDREVCS